MSVVSIQVFLNCIQTTYSALRRIFGLTREEVTGGWRKMHNEELHNLYHSPNIIMMTKSRRMRWVEETTRKT
jgi:hypothetical protein